MRLADETPSALVNRIRVRRGLRLERVRGESLASAVWELDPGASVDYHFHHGTKELLLVLRAG